MNDTTFCKWWFKFRMLVQTEHFPNLVCKVTHLDIASSFAFTVFYNL